MSKPIDHSDARKFARKVIRTGSNERAVNLAHSYQVLGELVESMALERSASRQRLRALLRQVEHAFASLESDEVPKKLQEVCR